MPKPRLYSGMQPSSGSLHLGNYIGALQQWRRMQDDNEAFFSIVDLHAITVPQAPDVLREQVRTLAAQYIAGGIDPSVSCLYVQSHVAAHAQLQWLLSTLTGFGEASRMTQFKDKASKSGQDAASVGLFTYPILMAADILLYDTDWVPVGADQRQHLELTRDLAERFNTRYGDTFKVPDAAIPHVGARIMDLQDPTIKMSKSRSSPQGKIVLLEPPEAIAKKIKRAVTDTETEVRFDPEKKPGVANLLTMLAVATRRSPEELAGEYSQYGPLKADTAAAVVEFLRPLHERFGELSADRGYVHDVLAKGAEKAAEVAYATLRRAQNAIGLLPR